VYQPNSTKENEMSMADYAAEAQAADFRRAELARQQANAAAAERALKAAELRASLKGK
jgi:hypothetical protein